MKNKPKILKIVHILLLILAMAVVLRQWHVAAKKQTEVFDTLAEQPINSARHIPEATLQFAVKQNFYAGNGYVDCVVASSDALRLFPNDVTQPADQQLAEAAATVLATLKMKGYDWNAEHPGAVPGKSYAQLFFFEGGKAPAKAIFSIDGNVLYWTVEVEDGWLTCRYTADPDALEIVAKAPYDLYLSR